MKYFKLMLIPLITFMFMVPTKAVDEVPPWVNSGSYYVVSEYIPSGQLTAFVLSSSSDMVRKRWNTSVPFGYYVPVSDVIETWRLENGMWSIYSGGSFADIDGIRHSAISFDSQDYAFRFSNYDVKSNGDLVFPATPVISLAMVTQTAVETLEMEVQGTSGTISLVGGLILGTMLVVQLVSRLRHWAMH